MVHRVGTCEEGKCCIWFASLVPGFDDVAGGPMNVVNGDSTCGTGCCYPLNALRYVWIQGGHFAAAAGDCGSCCSRVKSQRTGSHKNRGRSPGTPGRCWHSSDWKAGAALATHSDTGYLNMASGSDSF